MAEVTMKFLGPSLMLTNSLFPEDRLSEVMVLQQHCGGSTLCVFRELLPPNSKLTKCRQFRSLPYCDRDGTVSEHFHWLSNDIARCLGV